MGNWSSKLNRSTQKSTTDERDFMVRVKDTVNDEIARRMMQQREIQVAVSISQARDAVWYYGSAWSVLVTGVSVAHFMGRKPPPVVGVPIVIGALALGNLVDLAYGNKMMRVVKEAEHIMEHERGRFVPFKQAPFHKFYTDEEKSQLYDISAPVGNVFPNPYLFGNFRGGKNPANISKTQ